jgi:hypothetical protein
VNCGPRSNFLYIAITCLLSRILLLFSTRYAHSFVYSKPVPHRKLGAKYLVMLCAGSALLLVEDTLTSIVNGALVGSY